MLCCREIYKSVNQVSVMSTMVSSAQTKMMCAGVRRSRSRIVALGAKGENANIN